MSSPLDSNDLFVLKHLWKMSSESDRRLLCDALNDDESPPELNPEQISFSAPKRIWSRLNQYERNLWREFLIAEGADSL